MDNNTIQKVFVPIHLIPDPFRTSSVLSKGNRSEYSTQNSIYLLHKMMSLNQDLHDCSVEIQYPVLCILEFL